MRPGLPVLMATGYSDQDIEPLLEGRAHVQCLRKPFSKDELQLKLAQFTFSREGDAEGPRHST